MRILLDQAVHDHRNKGNNSLLEVPLARLHRQWPDASLEVLSISPQFCKVYLPGTIPISPYDLLEKGKRLEIAHRIVPRPVWQLFFEARERLRQAKRANQAARTTVHTPEPAHTQGKITGMGPNLPNNVSISPAVRYSRIADYDLYMPTGGGYMCDFDQRFLYDMFDRLEAAVTHRVTAVMVGQGIGPIEDPNLRARASQVLPLLDYIMIREERVARPLLELLNAPAEKAIMTGDDAIELAYAARKNSLGTGIGLSLRIAAYTQVDNAHVNAIRPIIRQAAQKYAAELVAAPIDVNEADLSYIEAIMEGYPRRSSSWMRFESTTHLINRISRCRIMIAGTFHGAVFALSQGIPVVALAKSVEYQNKLTGLTTEFGQEGCQVIHLHEADMPQKLAHAIDAAWSAAEQLRPHLLQQAKRQIDMSLAAYQKIYDLVETRQQEKRRARPN